MTTINDIAVAAGVSPSTVSNVINGKKNVGEDTKVRILQLCEEMEYYHSDSSRRIQSGANNTVLFNFSDFDRNFYLKVIKGISDYLTVNNFDLMICTQKTATKFMNSSMTCGSIILDAAMKTEVMKKAANHDYPIVVMDRIMEHRNVKSVVVNNITPMTDLVQRLVDHGYKRYGFIGGLEYTDDNKERYQAFLQTLEANNIPFYRKNYYSGDYREKSGYTAAKIIQLSRDIPEVIVCANDNMAFGAIRAFRESGVKVPEDVAVTGFDNDDLAELMGITTVDIPYYEIGYMAAQCLVDMIRGNTDNDPLKITASVKWRETTGKSHDE